MSSKCERPVETAAPIRNFTIPLADKIRAAYGIPAYLRRKRQIEDLEEALTATLTEMRSLLDAPEPRSLLRAASDDQLIVAMVARLNRLIETHNRWYPAEANLGLDPRTSAIMERGRPWQPLPRVTLEGLVARMFREGGSRLP